MIWLIVAIAAVGITVLVMRNKDKENNSFETGDLMIVGALALIGIAIYMLGNLICAQIVIPAYNIGEEVKIASLDNRSMLQGSFTLGTGHIDQELHYVYMEETDRGGYRLSQVPAEDTTIFEWDQVDGKVVTRNPNFMSIAWSVHFTKAYDIYIPEGSIIREYNPNN